MIPKPYVDWKNKKNQESALIDQIVKKYVCCTNVFQHEINCIKIIASNMVLNRVIECKKYKLHLPHACCKLAITN